MSDTLVVVGGGGSGKAEAGTPPPVPSLTSLITPDALSDLRELLLRQDARGTLIGISAVRTLLLSEVLEHVKTIGSDYKRVADYVAPPVPDSGTPLPAASPSGGTAAAAASRMIVDFGNRMAAVVTVPVEQLRTTVDGQGRAIDKGAAGISELQTALTVSDARLQALEMRFQRLDAAHRGLSDRVAEMGFELVESEAATEALGEAVREAGSPVIVVVEEGRDEDPSEPVRQPPARPMRQAGGYVRKAKVGKKK